MSSERGELLELLSQVMNGVPQEEEPTQDELPNMPEPENYTFVAALPQQFKVYGVSFVMNQKVTLKETGKTAKATLQIGIQVYNTKFGVLEGTVGEWVVFNGNKYGNGAPAAWIGVLAGLIAEQANAKTLVITDWMCEDIQVHNEVEV